MQESTWAIIAVGIGLAGLIITMIRNLKNDLTKEFDSKFDKLDDRMDRFENRMDALSGKLANIDIRVIEVEKHLFAVRTYLNYEGSDKNEKIK